MDRRIITLHVGKGVPCEGGIVLAHDVRIALGFNIAHHRDALKVPQMHASDKGECQPLL